LRIKVGLGKDDDDLVKLQVAQANCRLQSVACFFRVFYGSSNRQKTVVIIVISGLRKTRHDDEESEDGY
jgi:hypothetical protein